MEEVRIKAEIRAGEGKDLPGNSEGRGHSCDSLRKGRGAHCSFYLIKGLAAARGPYEEQRGNKMELRDAGNMEERPVMVKNVQKRPVGHAVVHVDFSAGVDGEGGPG